MDLMELKNVVNNLPVTLVFATASANEPNATMEQVKEGEGEHKLLSLYKGKRFFSAEDIEGQEGNFNCLCPFHNDTSEGSLVVTYRPNSGKNLWKCFACDAGKNNVDFEMKFYDLGFKDAVMHLAYRAGVIDEKAMTNGSIKTIKPESVKLPEENKKPSVEMVVADEDVISYVYSAMIKLYKVSPSHSKHLLLKRNVLFYQREYFSFPVDRNVYEDVLEFFVREYLANIKAPNVAPTLEQILLAKSQPFYMKLVEQFKNVPGFYYDEKNQRVTMDTHYGDLGLVAFDDLGNAKGVQIQNFNSSGPKYIWFSSQSKLGEEGIKGGSSVGAQGGVIFPVDYKGDRKDFSNFPIVITEGKYKAEALASKDMIAIYIPGVSSWEVVIPMIERLRGNRNSVYIAFDADSLGNTAVFTQLSNLSEKLFSMNLEPLILSWSKKMGKGFDDLVNSDKMRMEPELYKKYIKAFKFPSLQKIQAACYAELQKHMKKELKDLTKDQKKMFVKTFQNKMEQILQLKSN